MLKKFLYHLFFIVWFVGGAGSVLSQTWQAKYLVNSSATPSNGWPPGLGSFPASGLSMQIKGTPTQPGSYRLVVYPMQGGQIGDMMQVQITILPKGSKLIPQYYGYLRNPLSFSSELSGAFSNISNFALAGTGGRILFQSFASNGAGLFYFTSDGNNFVPVGMPKTFPSLASLSGVAAASGVFICFDESEEIFIKSTGGNFFTVPNSLYGKIDFDAGTIQLVSDGFRVYIFQLDTDTSKLKIFDSNLFISQPVLLWQGSVPGLQDMDLASAATDGSRRLFSVGDKQNNSMVVVRGTGSGSYTPMYGQIASVAWGNGFFLGSSRKGIFKSTNGGATWTSLASLSDAGSMIYANGLFFSPRLGVSYDGVRWLPFGNFPEQNLYGLGVRIVSSGGKPNVLCFANRLLSQKKAPTFKGESIYLGRYDQPYLGVVGKPFVGPKFELNP